MSNGSILPPDLKPQIAKQVARSSGGGIGGGAHENLASARARQAAVNPDAVLEDEPPPIEETPKDTDLKVCPNTRCQKDLQDEWTFCARCGTDLVRGGAAKKLGITWTEQDVMDYLFKGYIVRDLTILGKHKITVKSSQPSDMDQIDDFIMNGEWNKTKKGSTDRKTSEFYLRQINQLSMTAANVLKFDGESIGATVEDRVKYLMERGAALVDMISLRVQLFNLALTEHLRKEDTLLGS